MHVCALIDRLRRASGVRRDTTAGSKPSAGFFFFVAVELFCSTPCCVSSCLSFRLGLSILPPPAPLKDHLAWMRPLNRPVMLPCLTHFGCTSAHSCSPGVLPGRVWLFSRRDARPYGCVSSWGDDAGCDVGCESEFNPSIASCQR